MTQAELAGILKGIADNNGGVLDPKAVVDAARDRKHPLHDRFEWNNDRASDKYRISQARTLIRSVKLIVHTSTTRVKSVFYMRDPEAAAGQRGYSSLPRIREADETRRAAVVAEFERAAGALTRARNQALALGMTVEARIANEALRLLQPTLTVGEEETAEAATA